MSAMAVLATLMLSASAEVDPLNAVHETVRSGLVFISIEAETETGDAVTASLTGTVVTPDGLVLTVNHGLAELERRGKLRRDALRFYGAIGNKFGLRQPLEVRKADVARDLLVLKLPSGLGEYAFVCFASQERRIVRPLQQVYSGGFPRVQPFILLSGSVTSLDGPNDTFTTNIPIGAGQSGSPVYLEDGRLVGVAQGEIKDSVGAGYTVIKIGDAIPLLPELPPRCLRLDGVPLAKTITIDGGNLSGVQDYKGATVVLRGDILLRGAGAEIKAGKVVSEGASIYAFKNGKAPDGQDGGTGTAGRDGTSYSGERGGNGDAAAAGLNGKDGRRAGAIVISAKRFEGGLKIYGSGENGGSAGRGGRGGDGGRGGTGNDAVSSLFDCRSGPGNGGDGGNAGRGGDGGRGGNGGDGASATLSFTEVAPSSRIEVDAAGGIGGDGGRGGLPGKPGDGGERGNTAGLCGSGGRGPGSAGQPAASGADGQRGEAGEDGSVTLQVGTQVEVRRRGVVREF